MYVCMYYCGWDEEGMVSTIETMYFEKKGER